jgi:hypothetical protein
MNRSAVAARSACLRSMSRLFAGIVAKHPCLATFGAAADRERLVAVCTPLQTGARTCVQRKLQPHSADEIWRAKHCVQRACWITMQLHVGHHKHLPLTSTGLDQARRIAAFEKQMGAVHLVMNCQKRIERLAVHWPSTAAGATCAGQPVFICEVEHSLAARRRIHSKYREQRIYLQKRTVLAPALLSPALRADPVGVQHIAVAANRPFEFYQVHFCPSDLVRRPSGYDNYDKCGIYEIVRCVNGWLGILVAYRCEQEIHHEHQ